jgi:glycosyltransferase involved in cell wall biosynthesis
MNATEVTVLMPVYNGERFLAEAVDSVLRQTLRDFEMLIIDDGSSDGTADILARYRDSRIRIVNNGRNLGLIATLNKGLDLARGALIARMDADDISLPRRLEVQHDYLRKHPEVGVCGTWFRTFGEGESRVVRPPTRPAEVAAHAFFYCPFAHPSVMIRRSSFDEFSLRYDAGALHAEDYDLWVRAGEHVALANVPEVLLHYRVHGAQISATAREQQAQTTGRVQRSQLLRLRPEATEDEIAWHLKVCQLDIPADRASLLRARAWLDLLLTLNDERVRYERAAFRNALGQMWYGLALRVAAADRRGRSAYYSRMYGGLSRAAIALHAKYLVRRLTGF